MLPSALMVMGPDSTADSAFATHIEAKRKATIVIREITFLRNVPIPESKCGLPEHKDCWNNPLFNFSTIHVTIPSLSVRAIVC